MKEALLSNCEKNFILKAALKLKRLDGRKLENFRSLKVLFGQNWGLCYVSLGETKVLTQVTCEIQEPKTTRPNEGLLFVNVELSSMAAPHFESGRPSDLSVQINRLLEKCLKDSKAVDLESLCIVAEEKVWVLRVDVNVLNHDGNLIDCASISALAALAHFKRPDVTINGQEIKVHDASERDPLPITLHHYPVCVSFALLNNSENIFADPTDIEERVSDASLTFAINAYKEICCLHLGGVALIRPKIILTCSIKAAERAREIVEIIKNALITDSEDRYLKKSMGFVDNFEWKKNTAMSEEKPKIQLSNITQRNKTESFSETLLLSDENNEKYKIINLGENCAELTSVESNKKVNKSNVAPNFKELEKNGKFEQATDSYGEGGFSKWLDAKPEFINQSDFDKNVMLESLVEAEKMETVEILTDSEEEVVILSSNDINNHQNRISEDNKQFRHNELIANVVSKLSDLESWKKDPDSKEEGEDDRDEDEEAECSTSSRRKKVSEGRSFRTTTKGSERYKTTMRCSTDVEDEIHEEDSDSDQRLECERLRVTFR